MYKLLITMVTVTMLFSACSKNDHNIDTIEELDAIVQDCYDNQLNSREEIEDNLIGAWKLIGIRSGWVNEFTKSDITLSINRDSIVLNNPAIGEVFKTVWNLKFQKVNTSEYYYLETKEEGFKNQLGVENFCKDYMYGTGRVADGQVYVYGKVD